MNASPIIVIGSFRGKTDLIGHYSAASDDSFECSSLRNIKIKKKNLQAATQH